MKKGASNKRRNHLRRHALPFGRGDMHLRRLAYAQRNGPQILHYISSTVSEGEYLPLSFTTDAEGCITQIAYPLCRIPLRIRHHRGQRTASRGYGRLSGRVQALQVRNQEPKNDQTARHRQSGDHKHHLPVDCPLHRKATGAPVKRRPGFSTAPVLLVRRSEHPRNLPGRQCFATL